MWYIYRQNNSGGSFTGPALNVHVEADNEEQAERNVLAYSDDIYFDGCENGQDCDCCGDRWRRVPSESEELDLREHVHDYGRGLRRTSNWDDETPYAYVIPKQGAPYNVVTPTSFYTYGKAGEGKLDVDPKEVVK